MSARGSHRGFENATDLSTARRPYYELGAWGHGIFTTPLVRIYEYTNERNLISTVQGRDVRVE
jgi:hypothetical protein